MFRKRFQKGTGKIYNQLEMDVPYPYGHSTQRRNFRSGSKSQHGKEKKVNLSPEA